MKKLSVKKIALLGSFTALALLMFIVESLFPSLILPGAKMGLSNIFTMLTLFLLGPLEAVILILARTILGCLIVGNMSALLYSLTAGLMSVTISVLLYRFAFPKVSIMAISITGAVIHNLVQTIVFCLITETPAYFSVMGYLLIFGVVAGSVVGLSTTLLIKYIPKDFFEKLLERN